MMHGTFAEFYNLQTLLITLFIDVTCDNRVKGYILHHY